MIMFGSKILPPAIHPPAIHPLAPNKDQIRLNSGLSGACLDLVLARGCVGGGSN